MTKLSKVVTFFDNSHFRQNPGFLKSKTRRRSDFSSASDGFSGDIALPNVEYEIEWRQQQSRTADYEDLEKYRDEFSKQKIEDVEEETGKAKDVQT